MRQSRRECSWRWVQILLFDLNATSRAGGVGRCRQPLRGDCEGIVTHALNQLSEAAVGWRDSGGRTWPRMRIRWWSILANSSSNSCQNCKLKTLYIHVNPRWMLSNPPPGRQTAVARDRGFDGRPRPAYRTSSPQLGRWLGCPSSSPV